MAVVSIADKLAKILKDSEQESYFRALGEFVHQYATVEAEMQLALRYFAGVKPNVSKAIFSGTKTDQGISYIRRIIEVKPPAAHKKAAKLEEAFKQLKAISDARNLILHYGAQATAGPVWIVTNKSVAHSERSLKKLELTIPMLRDMTVDLMKIGMHLSAFSFRVPKYLKKVVNPVLDASWLYTRPSQENGDQGRKVARKGRPRSRKRPQEAISGDTPKVGGAEAPRSAPGTPIVEILLRRPVSTDSTPVAD